MKARKCINLAGKLRIEKPVFRRLSRARHEEVSETIAIYSARERWHYCSLECPVQQRCKFYARYGEGGSR